MPRKEPANISVAPNSPSARPSASAIAGGEPGRAVGTATRANVRAGVAPSVREASSSTRIDRLERGDRLAQVERRGDERERDDDAGGGERELQARRPRPRRRGGPRADRGEQRDPGDRRRQHQRQLDQRDHQRAAAEAARRDQVGGRRADQTTISAIAAAVVRRREPERVERALLPERVDQLARRLRRRRSRAPAGSGTPARRRAPQRAAPEPAAGHGARAASAKAAKPVGSQARPRAGRRSSRSSTKAWATSCCLRAPHDARRVGRRRLELGRAARSPAARRSVASTSEPYTKPASAAPCVSLPTTPLTSGSSERTLARIASLAPARRLREHLARVVADRHALGADHERARRGLRGRRATRRRSPSAGHGEDELVAGELDRRPRACPPRRARRGASCSPRRTRRPATPWRIWAASSSEPANWSSRRAANCAHAVSASFIDAAADTTSGGFAVAVAARRRRRSRRRSRRRPARASHLTSAHHHRRRLHRGRRRARRARARAPRPRRG